ncbi:phospholipase A1-Igamma2, chloroplastic-like [Carya illinoinensis]|uniref:Fungal lipase-type domain-containing protein n=1 Tax=Carya illinoinensis TaxID=32201 RepID=A0A8T1QUK3_CARIL|nr:phospholipase A1-Igamma2, chloroplastic-like [Carya illinoinensis]KAG6658730.1 hypothetical protein CIPAW_04G182100 [Carya illinoinensis]
MLAISVSSTVLPAFSTIINTKNTLQSIIHVPVPFLVQNSHLGVSNFYTKTPTRLNVLLKTSDYSSSSTNLAETEKERSIPQVEQDEEEHEITIQSPAAESQLAKYFWHEIHGQNDWVDLLNPMDRRLRSELMRYGEMAQACYDAFDYNPFSKYCGTCRYMRSEFFDSLGMSQLGYDVSRYLFAASNINLPNFFRNSASPCKVLSKHANWIGYVAVSNDETSRRIGRRDITIAWRGTVTQLEWIEDIKDFLVPISSKIPCPDPTVKVQTGFFDLYTEKEEDSKYCRLSAREQILSKVRRLLDKYADEEVSITIKGHSLGAALAILSAYDIVETSLKELAADRPVVPVCVFSFAGPRVGNVMFRERLESTLGLKVLRVVNVHDMVPKVPGFFFNERSPPMMMKYAKWLPWSYSHVGVELELDHINSPFLKQAVHDDPIRAHNLEGLLHLLDGYHGKNHKFELASGRDIALVNKASDFLEDEYLVPANWRQDENKGMVRNKDGHWVQLERRVYDLYCHGAPDDDHVMHCLDLASDDQYHGDAAAAA